LAHRRAAQVQRLLFGEIVNQGGLLKRRAGGMVAGEHGVFPVGLRWNELY
jgi:hypothetical protein